MRIAVLGAGRQGLACAIDLLVEEEIVELLLMDGEEDVLEGARRRLDDPRVRFRRIDAASEPDLAAALQGCDAAVSAVPYFLNLNVTRAAIRARCPLTDMGGNTDVVFQQRALDAEARAAQIAVVPDLGLAPGLGNILAAGAIRDMDAVDSVKIRCGGLPVDPQPPLGYAIFFSIHGLLNEYSGESVALREGRIARIPTLTEPEWIVFPDPVGLCVAAHTSGGASTLPWTLEGRVERLDYKTVRYPGHWPRIRFLKELGLLETKPARFGRVTLPPREVAASLLEPLLDRPAVRDLVVLRVRARGRRGDEVAIRQYDILELGEEPPGTTAMMKLTADPTAAVALGLARGSYPEPGVHPAETAVDPDGIVAHLRSRGIDVTVSETSRRRGGEIR